MNVGQLLTVPDPPGMLYQLVYIEVGGTLERLRGESRTDNSLDLERTQRVVRQAVAEYVDSLAQHCGFEEVRLDFVLRGAFSLELLIHKPDGDLFQPALHEHFPDARAVLVEGAFTTKSGERINEVGCHRVAQRQGQLLQSGQHDRRYVRHPADHDAQGEVEH